MSPSVTYPEKKRKRKATTLTQKKKNSLLRSTPIPSLPDDLLLSCFARVSGLYYPTLSLVSKSFRSLIASPELRNTRLSLGRKESCLYVCLQSDHNPNPNPCWFILCRKPDRTITNGSSGNVFVPTSFPNSVSANSRKEINIDGLSNGLEWYNCLCVIENVSYIYCSGELKWCDVTKVEGWKKLELKGLKGLPDIERLDDYFQLVDYGGKLAFLWSELYCEKKIIRCAVIAIALEGHNIGEIHGEVEWCDEVLTVPKSFKSGYALTENV